MQNLLEKYHLSQVSREQNFSVGDIVRVHYKIKEGNKQRIQKYEGTVIAIKNKGAGKTFTVYRVSNYVGVERIFPLYSPTIQKIERLRSNKVRRAKIYYLKRKAGKEGRLKEIKKSLRPDQTFIKAQELKNASQKATETQPEIKEKEPEKDIPTPAQVEQAKKETPSEATQVSRQESAPKNKTT